MEIHEESPRSNNLLLHNYLFVCKLCFCSRMSTAQQIAGYHACIEFVGFDSSSHLQPLERKLCVCIQPENKHT